MTVVKSRVRSEIVDLSRKIFSRKGYKHTTMNDIAEAASMGKSSLYYYYKSKEEIFEAVVVREAQVLKKKLEKVIQEGKNPRESLKDYITFRLYHAKTVKNFYAVLKEDFPQQMKFVERIRSKFEDEEFKMVLEVLEKGVAEGSFKISNPQIGAIAFTTMLKGLELPLFLNKYSLAEKENIVNDLTDVLFFGLIKR